MSQPITWRSVTAPQFGSSAALLQSGSESVNQGIASLAGLAKGIADEEKGLRESSAIAALNQAKTDEERNTLFNTLSAKLSNSGITLDKLNTADQAQHTRLQNDAKFSTDQRVAESGLKTNELEQVGLGFENLTKQGEQQHQKTAFDLADKTALSKIAVDGSQIAANNSQMQSARVMDALHSLQLDEGRNKIQRDAANEAAATDYLKLSHDTAFQLNDGKGNVVPNDGLIQEALLKKYAASNIVAGMGNTETALHRADKLAAIAANAEFEKKKELSDHEQKFRNVASNRSAARESIKGLVDKGSNDFSDDYAVGMSLIDTAFADANEYPVEVIQQAVAAGLDWGGDLGEDKGDIKRFNAVLDSYRELHKKTQKLSNKEIGDKLKATK